MLFRWLIGKPISYLIMPSQLRIDSYAKQRKSRKQKNIKIMNSTLRSSKGARIDYCELRKGHGKPKKNEKIIIFAGGNGDFYENHMDEYMAWAKKYPKYRIVGFNFRGTLASRGSASSENDWVDDVCAVVEHYRKKGFHHNNILLNGHSLGGAIVTLAAARIFQNDRENAKNNNKNPNSIKSIKLINNRSFSSLADEILVSILGRFGSSFIASIIYGSILIFTCGLSLVSLITTVMVARLIFSLKENVVQALIKPWMEGLLWLSFGRMDVVSAYKSLPRNSVDHIVAKHDSIIKKRAGLHYVLKSQNASIKSHLKYIIEKNKSKKEVKKAKAELLNMKDSKVRFKDNPIDGKAAHLCSLSMLTTYHSLRKHRKRDALPSQIPGQEVMEHKIQHLFKM